MERICVSEKGTAPSYHKPLSVLESVGFDFIRVVRHKEELAELRALCDEVALKLRLIADCLDSRISTRVSGMMGKGKFVASNYDEVYSSVRIVPTHNQYARNVFEIPIEIETILEQLLEKEKLLLSYEDLLDSTLKSVRQNEDRQRIGSDFNASIST